MCEQGIKATIVYLQTGERVDVDPCIATIVQTLNDADVTTKASCCGHGKRPGNIALADGREIIIAANYEQGRAVDAAFPKLHQDTSAELHRALAEQDGRTIWALAVFIAAFVSVGISPNWLALPLILFWLTVALGMYILTRKDVLSEKEFDKEIDRFIGNYRYDDRKNKVDPSPPRACTCHPDDDRPNPCPFDTRATPSAMGDEAAWLVEIPASAGLKTTYLSAAGPKRGDWKFTRDASEALRFAREQDAKVIADALHMGCVAREHMWSAARRATGEGE